MVAGRREQLKRTVARIFWGLSLIALASLTADYGFYLPGSLNGFLKRLDLGIVLVFLVLFCMQVALARRPFSFLKRHWIETSIAFLIVINAVWAWSVLGFGEIFTSGTTSLAKVFLVSSQILILVTIASQAIRENHRIAKLKFHPSQVVILSFLLVILLGTLMLMLPRATGPEHSIGFLDALFTSTSATCVTGLAVVDTGTHFTTFGQAIILCLIQVGGLGIMTLSGFLALFFGKGVSLRDRVFLLDVMDVDGLGQITGTLKNVVFFTLALETLGAMMIFFFWDDKGWTLGRRVFESVFHSVSAFCNGGFSTQPNSLMAESHNPGLLFSISLMIILGGLGFTVILEVIRNLVWKKTIKKVFYRWSLQTKMVAVLTLGFLLVGAVLLFFDPALDGPLGRRLTHALFTSVTTRTAGFNTIDFAAFSIPATLIIMMMMMVGGAPGSTAGGIKLTTVGVFWGTLGSILAGKERVEMFHKTIPNSVVRRALVVFFFSMIIVMLGTIALTLTEDAGLVDIMFESLSAFATVGISRGFTGELSGAGRIIVTMLMFIGRLGPLTLAFAITDHRHSGRVLFPEESVMVG